MSAQVIEEFVQAAAPGFRCSAAGDDSGGEFLARVSHVLNGPAAPGAIVQLRAMLGSHADQVARFYERHDGFVLYQDTESDEAGVELFPVARWRKATEDMREWFSHLEEEPENDPDHILTGIAIGEVPHSGNYFVMPIEGPSAGKIFYADHDGWYESPFADDFDGFLKHVCSDPVTLLNDELGCYICYSDGTTDEQWIPEEYFSDISKVEL